MILTRTLFSLTATAFCASAAIAQFSQSIPTDGSGPAIRLAINLPDETLEDVVFGAPIDWVGEFSSTLEAPITWAFTAPTDTTAADSLACASVVNDLTDSLALVRRGACNFSTKVANAVDAGAIGVIICNSDAQSPDGVLNLGGPDTIVADVPVALLSFNTCARIAAVIDTGGQVTATFRPQALSNPSVFGQAVVPIDQVRQPNGVNYIADYFNPEPVDSIFTGYLSVVGPGGGDRDTIATVLDTIQPNEGELIFFGDVDYDYPDGVGEYEFTISSSLPTANQLVFQVDISQDFYQTLPLDATQLGAAGVADATYASLGSIQSVGIVFGVVEPVNALSYSFGLCNGAELLDSASGDYPIANVELFTFDADGDGDIDIDSFVTGTQTLTQALRSDANIIGFTEYEITGEEQCFSTLDSSTITVNLEPTAEDAAAITLDSGIYAVRVTINSSEFDSPVAPVFFGQNVEQRAQGVLIDSTTGLVLASRFLSFESSADEGSTFSGFNGFTLFSRLTVGEPSSTRDFEPLAGSFTLRPNPATDQTMLDYVIDGGARDATVEVYSLSGQPVYRADVPPGEAGTILIPTGALPGGFYAVRVVSGGAARVLPLTVTRDR